MNGATLLASVLPLQVKHAKIGKAMRDLGFNVRRQEENSQAELPGREAANSMGGARPSRHWAPAEQPSTALSSTGPSQAPVNPGQYLFG